MGGQEKLDAYRQRVVDSDIQEVSSAVAIEEACVVEADTGEKSAAVDGIVAEAVVGKRDAGDVPVVVPTIEVQFWFAVKGALK